MTKKETKIFDGKVYRYWSMSKKKATAEASAKKMRDHGCLARTSTLSWKSCPVCEPKDYYVVWVRCPRDVP
jgi:hypothetical protein